MSSIISSTGCDGLISEEKPHHYTYLRDFRTKQCPEFLQHKCTQHRPFTCFNWHFANQKRRRPVRRKDGTFTYSSDVYCTKFDETTGVCPDGDDCPLLHRTAGDTERRYHLRYYKTCPCVYETDSKGNCTKNGPHCAFAHGPADLRRPIYDVHEMETVQNHCGPATILDSPLGASLESDRMLNEDPVWNDPKYVLSNYKTDICRRPLRLCRQGYACPSYHNPRDKRRSPAVVKYRSTPCPNVKQGDEWGDPSKCENGEGCGYCHTRTEQQFHLEIYKSTKCNDMVQTGYCPRGLFCAFAHTEQEMSMQWDVCLNESTLSAYIDNALSPHHMNGRSDDDMRLSAVGEERTRRNTMPSMQQLNKELFVKTIAECSGGKGNCSGFIPSLSSPQQRSSWRPADAVNDDVMGNNLSSSLNDEFLMSQFLRSSGQSAADYLADRPVRQSSQSVGSYQQYQRYREELAKLAASNSANQGHVFGKPQSTVLSPQHQRPFGMSNGAMPLPASFFTSATTPLVMTTSASSVGIPLPPSFYTNGNSSINSVAEDDLDLDLADLNLEPLEDEALDTAVPSRASFAGQPTQLTRHARSSQDMAAMLATRQQHNPMSMAAPPGLGSSLPPGLGGHVALPGNQIRKVSGAANNVSSEELVRLQHELVEKKQMMMKWEEGMKQAATACQAWKNEAEQQERLMRQMEEERNKSFARRDAVLAQVAEMRREIDMVNGGSNGGHPAPMLRTLHQDINLQHMPLTTVHQLHTSIQHDLECIEQVMKNRGVCLVCMERRATICVNPCAHTVLCYTCAMTTSDCPMCGLHILQHVSSAPQPAQLLVQSTPPSM